MKTKTKSKHAEMFNRVQVWALAGLLKRSGVDRRQESLSTLLPSLI